MPSFARMATSRRNKKRRHSAWWIAPGWIGVENTSMNFQIETEQETDGRWIAEVQQLPGVLTYGVTREEAVARVKALALRVLADRLEHGGVVPEMSNVFSIAA